MKVTHIFWSLGFGGIETMLVNIANAQSEAGAEVNVVLIDNCVESSLRNALDSRVKLHVIGRRKGGLLIGAVYKLNCLLAEIKPDVIHLHGSVFFKMILRRRLSRVACSTLHALPTGSVRREGIMEYLCRKLRRKSAPYSNVINIDKVPKVFAISCAVQSALRDAYGVESTVVCNGIVTSRFAVRPLRMPGRQLRIVMVSRLEHEKKGQDLLIRAVASLQGEVVADFIGVGSSMEYLKELVAKLHVESYVCFLGKQTQAYVADHLADYDLFVQPSRWEGFGLTVAEAMAAGVPVLVSEGQGPAEVTQGNRYGWVFANGDADDLKQQIAFIREHYDKAMAKACESRGYVKNMYDVSVTARTYLREYGDLCKKEEPTFTGRDKSVSDLIS